MSRPIRIPFRFKILVAVLFVVTAVVSFITMTMAHMFHEDKAAYVSDLASVIAVHTADEAAILLGGCRDRLLIMSRQLDETEGARSRPAASLRSQFENMPGLLALSLVEGGAEVATLVDTVALDRGGVDRQRFLERLAEERAMSDQTTPLRPRVVNSTLSAKLPSLTLSVAVPRRERQPRRVLIGVLDQTRLLSLGRSSQAFEVFLADSLGNVLSHGDARYVTGSTRFDWLPRLPDGSLAVVKEYSRGGVDMVGGFARVGFGDLVAGAQIPRSAAFFATRRLLQDLMLVALGLLVAVAIVSLWWSGRVTRSLVRLAEATEVIGRGDFEFRVEVGSHDEMGQLAASVNQMAGELRTRDRALQDTQMALIQSEKMAAFGQLGAGIAHEVKNPLAGIQGIVQLSSRGLKPGDPMHETLGIIEKETKRCRSIIDNLLRFARQEKLEPRPLELAGVVQDTAAILRHQMSLHEVELRTSVEADLPRIQGNPNQLQQVLMNLVINAEQAIEQSGKRGVVELIVSRAGPDGVEIVVRDNGPGIPAHVVPRIFEPFFTTKPTGKGTGLGLSVTFGIIREHGGSIRVESEVGEGTTFVISLPVPSAGAAASPARPPGDAPPNESLRPAA